jgi:hypothetical protein
MKQRKYEIGGAATKLWHKLNGKFPKGQNGINNQDPWAAWGGSNYTPPVDNLYDDPNNPQYKINPSQYNALGKVPDLTQPVKQQQQLNGSNNDDDQSQDPWAKLDAAALTTTAFMNIIQNGKLKHQEHQQYLQSIQPRIYQNYGGPGINNTASYYQKGGQVISYPNEVMAGIPRWALNNGDYEIASRQMGGNISYPNQQDPGIPRWIANSGDYQIDARQNGGISPEKAAQILHDGTIRGHKITDKQRRFFGAMSDKKQNGGNDAPYEEGINYQYEHGGELNEIHERDHDSDDYKNGGIHIKKSHEGLFTKKAKEHGKSAQAFALQVLRDKSKYDSSTVKQANFAHNFGGKKQNGGYTVGQTLNLSPEKIEELKKNGYEFELA